MKPRQITAREISVAGFKTISSALLAAVAAGLLWFAASIHLQRTCVVADAPYLLLCNNTVPDFDPGGPEGLRARLRDNPGETSAWVALANIESGPAREQLLRAITVLAPSEPDTLRLRAQQALAQREMTLATELLVKMTNHRVGGTEPPHLLAALVASGEGTPLLRPHLVENSTWLPQVLASISALKLPLQTAAPLLAEATNKGIVTPQVVLSTVRALKTQGKWREAHTLWIALQPKPAPILFNGGFDERFQAGGFDWETAASPQGRAGALFLQRSMPDRGQVLEMQFTGRAVPIPIVRQFLFLPPGRYALNGQYMSSRLRMEQGLAWAVRCTEGKNVVAGRSEAMQDTADVWQNFGFELEIPADCGMVAGLQLETYAPFEATAGFRGKVLFDGFELRRLAW
jgi:hypothetical protein